MTTTPPGTPDAPKPTIVFRRRGQAAAGHVERRLLVTDPGDAQGDRGGSASSHTILCVEDSPIHLKLIGRQLEHALGCRVLSADDVEAAVEYLLREPPDLIVTDLMMPVLDGTDLIAILQTTPAWRDIPVVVHSADGDLGRVRGLIDSGVRDYILKPFNVDVAVPKFKRILATLPPRETTAPVERPSTDPDRIPILVASRATDIVEELRGVLGPLYDLIAVTSGPEAVVAAVQLKPWAALLGRVAGPWDTPKTWKSLLGLKGFELIRCLPFHELEAGDPARSEAIERELGPAPFSVRHDSGQTIVTIHETFTAVCTGAVRRAVAEASAVGTKQIVIDVPVQALALSTLSALQRLRNLLARPD
jgi:CheY-like chemotaxis protein